MYDILIVFVHLIVTVVRLIKPGGLCAVVAESVLARHQILILNRSRKRAPNLRGSDYRRFMHPAHAPVSPAAMWHGPKTVDAAAFSCIIKGRPAFKGGGCSRYRLCFALLQRWWGAVCSWIGWVRAKDNLPGGKRHGRMTFP